jgi:hypothetical protein
VLFAQSQRGNLRQGFRFLQGYHIPIRQRRANVLMPHEFLLDRDRSSDRIQPGAVAVPQSMRPKASDAGPVGGLLEDPPDSWIGDRKPSELERRGKDEVVRCREVALLFP